MKKFLISLFFGLLTLSAFSQNLQTYTFRIVNANGDEPIPFVSVLRKGTTIGWVSNNNGDVTVSNVSYNTVLVFSCTGFQSVEYTVAQIKAMSNIVRLNEDISIESKKKELGRQKK